jgi:hypothetical protein
MHADGSFIRSGQSVVALPVDDRRFRNPVARHALRHILASQASPAAIIEREIQWLVFREIWNTM